MNCPLERTATPADPRERSGRYSPTNADAALCYQLHDTLRLCFGVAQVNDRALFSRQLGVLESQIAAHRKMHNL